MMSSSSSVAEALKQEGNALYGEGKFTEALRKYDDGLAHECSSKIYIVLKLNSAACLLALRRFPETIRICEELLGNSGELGEKREKTVYRLISALLGLAESTDGDGELKRARQLLDDLTREKTLKSALQTRIFALARSSSIKLQPPSGTYDTLYVPPVGDTAAVMLLVILHGFGDGKKALGELAGKMHLPGVACLVARGERRLPDGILPAEPSNEIGYFWYDNIDWSDGTTLPRGDNSLKDSAVNAVNRLSEYITSSLIQTCGWKSNEIAFLGVGQGGTIALEIGRRMEEEFAGLFVLSPDELPLACPEEKRRVTQRVVLINGRKDEAPSGCVQAIESELKLEGDIVQLHELNGKAMDVLKDQNGEGEIFMCFIASRLAAIRMRSLGAEEVN